MAAEDISKKLLAIKSIQQRWLLARSGWRLNFKLLSRSPVVSIFSSTLPLGCLAFVSVVFLRLPPLY